MQPHSAGHDGCPFAPSLLIITVFAARRGTARSTSYGSHFTSFLPLASHVSLSHLPHRPRLMGSNTLTRRRLNKYTQISFIDCRHRLQPYTCQPPEKIMPSLPLSCYYTFKTFLISSQSISQSGYAAPLTSFFCSTS